MPSETIYFQGKHLEALDEMVENDDGINNRSQAVQSLINQQMQRDIINEERD